MNDMTIINETKCVPSCNVVKYSLKEKMVPISLDAMCTKPFGFYLSINQKFKLQKSGIY